MSIESAEGYCARQGLSADDARRLVAEARQRLTVAADYARDEHLGKAVMRLEDLYAQSIRNKDIRTTLQAQRELNRLLSLYADTKPPPGHDDADADDAAARLETIASYLLPLKLTDPSYPVEEHARLAAERLRREAAPR